MKLDSLSPTTKSFKSSYLNTQNGTEYEQTILKYGEFLTCKKFNQIVNQKPPKEKMSIPIHQMRKKQKSNARGEKVQ